jgi:hypothetical protein
MSPRPSRGRAPGAPCCGGLRPARGAARACPAATAGDIADSATSRRPDLSASRAAGCVGGGPGAWGAKAVPGQGAAACRQSRGAVRPQGAAGRAGRVAGRAARAGPVAPIGRGGGRPLWPCRPVLRHTWAGADRCCRVARRCRSWRLTDGVLWRSSGQGGGQGSAGWRGRFRGCAAAGGRGAARAALRPAAAGRGYGHERARAAASRPHRP